MISIGTFNRGGFPQLPYRKVAEDDAKVRDLASLWMWQELWNVGAVNTVVRSFRTGRTRWRHVMGGNLRDGVGISFDNSKWRLVASGWHLLHHKVPYVCNRRIILELSLTHRGSGVNICAMSTHHAPKRGGRGRPAQFYGNFRLRRRIAAHVKRGQPVVVGVDANQKAGFLGKRIRGQRIRYVTGVAHGGVDHLLFIDGATHRWRIEDIHILRGTNSDHDPVYALVELVKK